MTKQYFAARYFNAAYYMDWLGTFDESVGYPLWDTSQGMARSNIKFTPIADVSVQVSATKTVIVSTTSSRGHGSAVAKAQSCGANSGCISQITRVRANAFVRAQRHGGFTTVRGARTSGSSTATHSRVVCGVGYRGTGSRADAAAVAAAAICFGGAAERAKGLGVQNPSDEEVAAMITMLVTKKTTRKPLQQLHR